MNSVSARDKRSVANRAFVVLPILLLTLTSIAAATELSAQRDCSRQSDDSRCEWERRGEPALESKEHEDDEAIRIIGVVALRQDNSIMVEFGHSKDGGTWMTFRDPYHTERGATISVPHAIWARIMVVWNEFDRRQKEWEKWHERQEAKEAQVGETVVCTDSTELSVDAVVGGEIRHLNADSCQNQYTDNFVADVRRLTYSQLPWCFQLKWSELCLALDGDKFMAARVMKRALSLDDEHCESDAPARAALPLLMTNAVLRISGKAEIRGRRSVANGWQAYICNLRAPLGPWPDSAVGTSKEVVIDGLITSGGAFRSGSERVFTYAHSTQTWILGSDGMFRMRLWEIGEPVERLER